MLENKERFLSYFEIFQLFVSTYYFAKKCSFYLENQLFKTPSKRKSLFMVQI